MSPDSSAPPAIRIDGISKRYRLGSRQERADTLAGTFKQALLTPWRNFQRLRGMRSFDEQDDDTILWALRDVGFEVRPGEVVGLIGRNGAGKSTLLKILSRITPPTSGRIEIRGRIASLLEVGTGFHPDLTGRDNIFLNGSLLGLKRREIMAQFDEIVEFSGISRFIDTPVKRYSSGMYVRLAFAVAAHLRPEILLVDEVLAVGDIDFQKKCLGKMGEVAKGGRAVIFVSHSMPAVRTLCQRCVLLERGQVRAIGPTGDVTSLYYGRNGGGAHECAFEPGSEPGDEFVRLLGGDVADANGDPLPAATMDQSVQVRMRYEVLKAEGRAFVPNFHFVNQEGVYLGVTNATNDANGVGFVLAEGIYETTCTIPGGILNEGLMMVGLAVTSYHPHTHVHFFEKGALSLQVREDRLNGRTGLGYGGTVPGFIRPRWAWTNRSIS